MLWTATNGLDRSPHVTLSRYQVPARRQECRGFHPASLVNLLRLIATTIGQDCRPHHISVTFYNCMRTTKLMRFVRIARGVNLSEHDLTAAAACDFPAFVV